jgi:single stranded DNA-binding protein
VQTRSSVKRGNNNGSKFTVLSVATQRSWKNIDDEWASKTEWHRVCVFRPRLAEYVATTIKKGSHVLVEGSLVSTTYERGNGKGKKAKTNKQTFWCIRADVVRKLDRGEPEPETVTSGSAGSSEALDATRVAGFHTWKQLRRNVKKGAKGIMVLAPVVLSESKEEATPEEAALAGAQSG